MTAVIAAITPTTIAAGDVINPSAFVNTPENPPAFTSPADSVPSARDTFALNVITFPNPISIGATFRCEELFLFVLRPLHSVCPQSSEYVSQYHGFLASEFPRS